MKIEKINENQIKIILSSDDLDARNLNMQELVYSNDKMQTLFREMMEQALIEHSFKTDNAPLMIEVALLSPDTIMIIVTKVDLSDANSSTDILNMVPKALEERFFRSRKIADTQPKPVQSDTLTVFSFAQLDDVILASKRLAERFDGESSLHKIMGRFCLIIHNDSKKNAVSFDVLLSEYGNKQFSSEISFAYLQEHGETIIKEGAVSKLAEM